MSVIQDMRLDDPDKGREEFSFGAYKSFQVPIRRVEELTGLGFGDLKDAEPAGTLEALGRESFGVREIAAPEDITL